MKKNKKAIFGLAIAMIFSLSLMQGISTNTNSNSNIQQVAAGCAYMACNSEGGAVGAWGIGAVYAGYIGDAALTGDSIFGWCPVGWAAFGVYVGSAV